MDEMTQSVATSQLFPQMSLSFPKGFENGMTWRSCVDSTWVSTHRGPSTKFTAWHSLLGDVGVLPSWERPPLLPLALRHT